MKTLLCISLFISASYSHAITVFEPSLSVGQANGTTIVNSTDAKFEGSGLLANFGARYGIARSYIHLTAILEGNFFQAENQDTQFVPMLGFGLGYEWNIPLRTYIIVGAYDFRDDHTGIGFELSYEFSESFWVGLRSMQVRGGLRQAVNNTEFDARLNLDSLALTMSFPFEFEYPDRWFRKAVKE